MSICSTGSSDVEFGPLALSPKKTAVALDCGLTRVYELINSGELDSYLDGASRKITTESIRRYQAKRLAASKSGDAPAKLHHKIAAATTARLAGVGARRIRRARPKVRSTSSAEVR